MDWLLQRYSDNKNSTQGLFFQKALPTNIWISHALEDEGRAIKVSGETRIDSGLWELKIAQIVMRFGQENHNFVPGTYIEEPITGKPYIKSSLPTRWQVIEIIDNTTFIIDVLSPLTLKHRIAYGDWFKHHIEISGLPRHRSVYVHAGNNETHTDACLLLGDTIHNHTIEKDKMERSIQAVKRFYTTCYPWLRSGKRSYLEIRDEIKLL